MTGWEISAENPGLTAGAGALLNLTLSGRWQGCRGGCWELRPGSTQKWGCRKLEFGRTKKLKERGYFLQGGDFFGEGPGDGRGVLRK